MVRKVKCQRAKGKIFISFLLIFSLLITTFYILPTTASAALPTVAYIRFDRHATGAALTGTVCINTTTAGTEAKIDVTFPTGWTVSATAANWTVTTTNLPSGATAWPGIGTATAVASQTVTFPSTDLSTSTLYCFNFAGASSTIGSAGNDQTGSFITKVSGGSAIDTTNFATSVVASGADQVSVTATVPATFSFALSGTSIALGTLSTSTTTSGNVTMTISTNARNGWIAWLKHVGFTSPSTSATIAPPSTYPTISDLASVTGFVIDADATTGSPTIAAGYNGTNTTSGGNPSTTFDQMASNTAPVSGNVVTVNARAKVSATQIAAADYADTLTIVAAGNF